MSGTYYIRYDGQNLDGSFSGVVSNAFGSTVVGVIPRWKHYAQLSLDSGPWTAYRRQHVPVGLHGLADRLQQQPAPGRAR